MTQARLSTLQSLIASSGSDFVALLPGPNLRYVTGLSFHLMERPVVAVFPQEGAPVIILPELEASKVEASSIVLVPFPYGEDEISRRAAFTAAARRLALPGRTLAVEFRRMRVLEARLLEESAKDMRLTEADPLLATLRMRKGPEELDFMGRAVEIAEEALRRTIPRVKVGMSERELAAELTLQTLRCGSDPELPFAPIVAAGPNAALPHALPGNRLLQPGDPVIIDWGASHNGYLADLTRTFCVERVGEEMEGAYQAVQRANQAGRDAVRPGVEAQEVDRAARAAIVAAGFGEYFVHRTGHGLGLEEHEEPFIVEGNSLHLEAGMTFTVEPGVYLRGKGGVRIEDDVVVTESSGRTLSSLPRDLQIIGA